MPELFTAGERAGRRESHLKSFACAGLIVSSHDARNDAQHFYPSECGKVEVVHFATFHDTITGLDSSAVRRKYNLPDRYVMCPNQLWIHKNHIVVIKALEELKREGLEIHIVFTGSESDHRARGYGEMLRGMAKDLGVDRCAHFLGFIPRDDQLMLLKEAEFIIQPSLFEGWSTVIEDAKAQGKYVIASDLRVHIEQVLENGQHSLYPIHHRS